MAKIDQRRMVRVLLERSGTTYTEEIGIRLQNKPAPLFQLLFSALLLSARIASGNAVQAARALIDAATASCLRRRRDPTAPDVSLLIRRACSSSEI